MEPPENEENNLSSQEKQIYQPQSAEEIKQQNIERINKNAEKIRELENQMSIIENQIEEIKIKATKNRIDEKVSKEEIDSLYQQTLKIYEEYNKPLKERVNKKFVEIFDEIAEKIEESERKRIELEDKKYDLSQTLLEFEKYKNDDDEREKKIENDIENIKSEYEFLQKNYDEVSKKNITLNKEIQQRNNEIGEKRKKINELRGVIGKLTEVRVILNKYFSSHFEHFTTKEKEIIKSVNNYKLIDNNKYNKAMNQLLETNEYGLSNYDDRKMTNHKNFNINTSSENNIGNRESMGMGDNTSKITDVNKSLEMSGMGGKENKND